MLIRARLVALMVLAAIGSATAEPAKTSKERLSDKASDEQRVDNCKVPSERRGVAVRPGCPVRPAPVAGSGAASPMSR